MSKAKVYTKTSCPWCVKAKQLLTEKGVQFEEHVIGENGVSKQSICEAVGREINTVPQIMLDEGTGLKYIGGYTDLAAHYGV